MPTCLVAQWATFDVITHNNCTASISSEFSIQVQSGVFFSFVEKGPAGDATDAPHWDRQGSNPGLRGERPATKRLSHGTA